MLSVKENLTGLILDRNKERLIDISLPLINRTRTYSGGNGETIIKDCYGEVIFFGDWHMGNEDFAENPFNAQLQYIIDNPHMRVWLMGDYIDYNITTNFINNENLTTEQQIDQMVEAFSLMKDQVIVIQPGNHAAGRMAKMTKSKRWLMHIALEAGIDLDKVLIPDPERGASAIISAGEFKYSVYAIHGSTGAIWNSNTQLKRMAQSRRETLLVMGHIHKILWEPRIYEELETINGETFKTIKQQFWLSSGSFLKDAAYAEAKSYPMSVVGAPIVRFSAISNSLDMYTLPYRSKDIKTLITNVVNTSSRPPCPECGNKNINSRGIQWHCKDCGRYYKK